MNEKLEKLIKSRNLLYGVRLLNKIGHTMIKSYEDGDFCMYNCENCTTWITYTVKISDKNGVAL